MKIENFKKKTEKWKPKKSLKVDLNLETIGLLSPIETTWICVCKDFDFGTLETTDIRDGKIWAGSGFALPSYGLGWQFTSLDPDKN